MKKILIVVGLVIAAVAVWLWMDHRGTATIDVPGKAGVKFAGTCVVDGATRELSGVVPAHFEIECEQAEFTLEVADAGVKVRFEVGLGTGGTVGETVNVPEYVSGSVDYRPFTPLWHIQSSNRPPAAK